MLELVELAKGIGPSTLVVIFVLGLATGWIIPRWTYKQTLATLDKALLLNDILAKQNSQLMIGAKVSAKVAEALHQTISGDDS